MKNITKSLMGTYSVPLILSILKNSDSYGQQIAKQANELSNGKINWKGGSLYPILKKLEAQNLIKSYWNITDYDRPRKYLNLLPKGILVLDDYKKELDLFNNIIHDLS